ncbi:MAG: PDDEXK family nuclease [Nitrosotalea sp.]
MSKYGNIRTTTLRGTFASKWEAKGENDLFLRKKKGEFKKGNTYGKGRKSEDITQEERNKKSIDQKMLWATKREEMIQKVKDGMAKPEVREKLRILNSRKRSPLTDLHKHHISDHRVGITPSNLMDPTKNHMRSLQGWIEINGKRIYMRSIWERNYARYLQWMKEVKMIKDWEYEPKIFIFNTIQFGNRSYKPDFKVIENDGSYKWHEVKGWMDAPSKTKLKRMAKYYPSEEIIIIDSDQYYTLKKQVQHLVPDWEIDQNRQRYYKPISYERIEKGFH